MEITLPRIDTLEETSTYGKFVVEPLERGYGVTLGNSLRRVMLSSIEGAAITHVKIDKVLHEFSTIPGIKEDTTELLLNLKEMFVKVDREAVPKGEPVTLRLRKKGEGRITGADVECPDGVHIANPEVYLATIASDDASLDMELTVELGKGYVLPDKHEKAAVQAIGVIPIGSAFTPVRRVNYTVEATRVGFKTDFERLILEVTTNGTIRPSAAISEAAVVLDRYFRHFMEFGGLPALAGADALAETEDGVSQVPDRRIEELDFSVRTYNCLKKAAILTIGELVQTTEAELMQIRNFGRKSLEEVRDKLSEWGLTLKGGVTIATGDAADEPAEPAEEA
jgi:DNA-directed RNA polymerase subunit alpha